MYWPKEGTETYGVIQVKLVKEDIMATYTVRTLQIRHLRVNVFRNFPHSTQLNVSISIPDQKEESRHGREVGIPVSLH